MSLQKTFDVANLNGYLYLVDVTIRGKEGWNINHVLNIKMKLPYDYKSHTSEWNFCNKIIASNDPTLTASGIPKIGEFYSGLHKDSYEEYDKFIKEGEGKNNYDLNKEEAAVHSDGFVWGYTIAASKKKYTEEDMRRLYEGTVQNVGTGVKREDMPTWKQVLESLKPIPKYIEIEMEDEYFDTEHQEVKKRQPSEIHLIKPKLSDKGEIIIKSIVYE